MRSHGWARCLATTWILAITLVIACGGDGDDEADQNGEVSVSIGEQEAISSARSFATAPGRTITVRVPYTTVERERVPCSPLEVERDRSARPNNPELWTCRTISGGNTYYRTRTTTVTECCRTREIRIPGSATWNATHSPAEDAWQVEVSFELDGVEQEASWSVDDRTGEVTQQ
jgi:hypothetical protein